MPGLAFARLEKQTRDFASLNIKADPAAVKLTDDEVKAYYDEHAKEFMTPDQVVIDYLELKKSSFFDQVSVKDEDLQAAYQKETANLSEQRRAAHILIEVNDKTTEAQAKAKIEEIQRVWPKAINSRLWPRSSPRIRVGQQRW
jgi:peptidyl-prolyl cis-trans isomerase D